MPQADIDAFERARQTTNAWLATVANELDTDDRRYALRVLRAWLHTVRDRLTVDSAAKFAAQLPEFLRGIYYDGWDPSRVPIKYGPDEFVSRFGFEARTGTADVAEASGAVTAALAQHVSGGQLNEVLAQLPHDLRDLVAGRRGDGGGDGAPHRRQPGTRRPDGDGGGGGGTSEDRLARIEGRLAAVADAVEVLARGMQQTPQAEPDPDRASRSARLATEILLAGRA